MSNENEIQDFSVDLGDGERVELAVAPGSSILMRVWSGGEEVDVALWPGRTELLIAALRGAIQVSDGEGR